VERGVSLCLAPERMGRAVGVAAGRWRWGASGGMLPGHSCKKAV